MNVDHVILPLAGTFIFLDPEDVSRVMEHNWYPSSDCYVQSSSAPGHLLHRFLMGAEQGEFIDHKSGQVWDCRKQNLRFCSREENAQNHRKRKNCTSRYKGVSRAVRGAKTYWFAQIKPASGRIPLGYFKDETLAAQAYDKAALEHFGAFAKVNFP